MKALEAISTINDLSASQRGLFTSAQAQALGVGRVALSRLEEYGHIERLAHGVYRTAGSPPLREEDVLAAWMGLDPKTPMYERQKGASDFVASLNTAAWLLGIGELNPVPMVFSYPRRHQTRKEGLVFLKREIEPSDITVVCGMPATTADRTIVDLIAYGEDLSLVAGVLHDALDAGLISDEDSISEQIGKYSKKRGLKAGSQLYQYLKGLR